MSPSLLRPSRLAAIAVTATLFSSALAAQQPTNKANWALSNKFNGQGLTGVTYTTAVGNNWINNSDSLWYAWSNHEGCSFYVVYPKTKAKTIMFDHGKMASQLSILHHKPFDPSKLPFNAVTFARDAKTFTFSVEGKRYEWNIASQTLRAAGLAPDSTATDSVAAAGRGRGQVQVDTSGRGGVQGRGGRGTGGAPQVPAIQPCGGGGGGRGAGAAAGGNNNATNTPAAGPGRGGAPNYRNYSPDSTMFVYGRNFNIYLVNVGKDTIQLSKDGATGFSFTGGGGGGGRGGQQQQQQDSTDQQQLGGGGAAQQADTVRQPSNTPVAVSNLYWSPDSKGFVVSRTDSRGIQQLYLVNSLATPRPELSAYNYPMPGEEATNRTMMYVWRKGDPALQTAKTHKWTYQSYQTWGQLATGTVVNNAGNDTTTGRGGRGGGVGGGGGRGGGGGGGAAAANRDAAGSARWEAPGKLRLGRRDRTQRKYDYVEFDLATNTEKVLISEIVDAANIENSAPIYVGRNGDMIRWSEQSGWGHYYLYDHNGKFKNAITTGQWRALPTPLMVDTIKRVMYVTGLGREAGENPYYRHTYRVNLDGSGFTLLDPGNASHSSSVAAISPSRRYYLDNSSRTDLPPRAVIRDSAGNLAMDLEVSDISRMKEIGWRNSEPFVVKAADGITEIWGNMFKPFDFDSTRKYPIIAHVYPGPQTESITFTWTTGGMQQRLANLGFIVIQIGNRGGSPDRSNSYQSYSYFNLRDYALADKKAGIEQLAVRHKWIDIDRVGIFGHSGGGFLTAAALMLPPYNDFFKVGVSSSGNHDNNIYNQNWSEQYHGLVEVVAPGAGSDATIAALMGRGGGGGANTALAAAGGGGGRGGRGGGGGGQTGVQQQGGRGANANTNANAVVATRGSITLPNGTRVVRVNDSTRYEIRVPSNVELAANLKGNLLLAHGDMDNNVTPSGTIRLMDALIKNNKRFDFILFPGQPHSYGPMQEYFTQRTMEYFAEHLLGDNYRNAADLNIKK